MFSRIGEQALKKDLTNTLELCAILGNPHQKFKSIHVAGTNGKGSTSHMLAAILQKAGYKTGLYTSPHLKDFRERIRINGTMISKRFVSQFIKKNQSYIDDINPSFFEVTVALAFQYFATQQVDIAIIEVGLGGRLDSTNIITPELSIITNIGYDHTQILGNSLTEIATEKAGVIKSNIPVVIGSFQAETWTIFKQKATELNAAISLADQTWFVKEHKLKNNHLHISLECPLKHPVHNKSETYIELDLDLTGNYQLKNVCTVLSAIKQIQSNGFLISKHAIQSGLQNVKKLTGLKGRWQILKKDPLCICDTGHNVDGITEVLKNIAETAHQHLHFVLGMVNDKAIDNVLALMPKNATYYFCKANIERGLEVSILQKTAQKYGLKGDKYDSVKDAYTQAQQNANKKDLIFIGGSTFVVAEIV